MNFHGWPQKKTKKVYDDPHPSHPLQSQSLKNPSAIGVTSTIPRKSPLDTF